MKWSGIWFLAGFALLSVLWDLGARRSAGLSRPVVATAARDLPGAVGAFGLAPVLAYLATWTGWFLGENSYGRHWADTNSGYWSWLPGPLRSLLHYHWQMWDFHSGLSTPHSYQSSPWGWLVTGRPVLFYYPSNPSPTGCGAQTCVRTVLDVGTPALWWAFAPAVLWAGWIAVARRDWRGWTVLVAFAAGWLTWFSVPGRTMFLFYMTPLVPFLVIGVTLALGTHARLGSVHRAAADPRPGRRLRLRRAGGGQLGLAVADPVRPAHHVPGVAGPDLVPVLDLTEKRSAAPVLTVSRGRPRPGGP